MQLRDVIKLDIMIYLLMWFIHFVYLIQGVVNEKKQKVLTAPPPSMKVSHTPSSLSLSLSIKSSPWMVSRCFCSILTIISIFHLWQNVVLKKKDGIMTLILYTFFVYSCCRCQWIWISRWLCSIFHLKKWPGKWLCLIFLFLLKLNLQNFWIRYAKQVKKYLLLIALTLNLHFSLL